MRKNVKSVKGSYTIEASLLMGIILPLLVAIIYMGFFLHDKGLLLGAAYETAACMSLRADDKDFDGASAAGKLIKGRALGSTGLTASASAGEKQAQVTCSGNFRVPGMAAIFFGTNGINVTANISMNIERPSKRIRKIRSIAKVADTFRRALE